MVAACEQKSSYVWQPDQSLAMIKYIQSQGQTIWGFELGNEVNNRQQSCNTTGGQQAAAFRRFQSEVLEKLYPDAATRPYLLGPDVGYLDPELFLGEFLGNYSDLHAVTYHVYSWLQRRNYDFAMPIDNSLRDGEGWYPGMVHSKAPGAQVWAGEDGPISGGEDGTCGGKFANGSSTGNSVCGTYATVPWYANDLGSRAVLGFAQYQRQDLIGGRYGLLGISHDGEALGLSDPLRIFPDFWVMHLWKRTMGSTVLNASAAAADTLDPDVRVYAHCGQPPSEHRATTGSNPLGMVLININVSESKAVTLQPGLGSEQDVGGAFTYWTLSADPNHAAAAAATGGPSLPELPPGVFGEGSLLNGSPLPRTLSDGKAIGAIPVAGKAAAGGEFTLPPFSVTFAVSAACPAGAL